MPPPLAGASFAGASFFSALGSGLHPPPAQLTSQVAVAAQLVWQFPPAQSTLHVVLAGQVVLQPPALQRTVHVEPGSHFVLQLPPGQSSVQVEPFSHFMSQLPPVQVRLHVCPASQLSLQPPSLQVAAAEAVALVPLPLAVPDGDPPGVAFVVPELSLGEPLSAWPLLLVELSSSEPPEPIPLPVPLPLPVAPARMLALQPVTPATNRIATKVETVTLDMYFDLRGKCSNEWRLHIRIMDGVAGPDIQPFLRSAWSMAACQMRRTLPEQIFSTSWSV